MRPAQWVAVKNQFAALAGLAAGERAARIAAIEDPVVRAEVESLLAAEDRLTRFLERPPPAPEPPPDRTGQLVGPYRLEREIGRGGMGTVWLAVRADGQFERRVAIKFPAAGSPLARALVEPMLRHETRLLAALDHPGIARLLDAGTSATGEPYLILEYVEGRPITHHVSAERLPYAARVDLVRAAAAALEHAHRRLILHCDLKPAHVCVTAEGAVKLLDFGLARLAEAAAAPPAWRAFTPGYASPEQTRDEITSVASDVYALGRILAETLATGPGPVPRDLAAVVARATAANPAERYHSAQKLDEDLGAWRERRPVAARPPTIAYRARCWMRRRPSVAAALAVAVLAAGVGFTTTWQQRNVARQERDFARSTATTMARELAGALARMSGPTEARLGLLREATTRLDVLDRDPADIAAALDLIDARLAMAETFRLLGQPEEALVQLGLVAARLRSLPDDLATLQRKVRYWTEVSQAHSGAGRETEATTAIAAAAELFEQLPPPEELPPVAALAWFSVASWQADRAVVEGRFAEAAAALSRMENLAHSLAPRLPPERRATAARRGAEAAGSLAHLARKRGDPAAAAAIEERALLAHRAAVEAAPADPNARLELGFALGRSAATLQQMGDFTGARDRLRESAAVFRTLAREDPRHVGKQSYLASALAALGDLALQENDLADAASALTEATEAARAIRRLASLGPRPSAVLAVNGALLAQVRARQGNFAAARAALAETVPLLEAALADDPTNVAYRRFRAVAWVGEALTAAGEGQYVAAWLAWEQAVGERRAVEQATGSAQEVVRRIETQLDALDALAGWSQRPSVLSLPAAVAETTRHWRREVAMDLIRAESEDWPIARTGEWRRVATRAAANEP
jgi:tetratricopeptide (TPR) repeat protein